MEMWADKAPVLLANMFLRLRHLVEHKILYFRKGKKSCQLKIMWQKEMMG